MSVKKIQHIAIIHPAGKSRLQENDRHDRLTEIRNLGFEVTEILPEQKSLDGCTAAPVLERATQLCHALTMRKYDIIMAARGGVGSTELIPFLEKMLPPVLPDKTLVGFSDISFLGAWLSAKFSNLRYIHGHLFYGSKPDRQILVELLQNKQKSFSHTVNLHEGIKKTKEKKIEGNSVTLNLALATSLACIRNFELPENNILFLEECNEPLYRIIRMTDSLINSHLLARTKAIVLGDFTNCTDAENKPLNRDLLLQIFAKKITLPILNLPIFGHGDSCFPLVHKAKVTIKLQSENAEISITNKMDPPVKPRDDRVSARDDRLTRGNNAPFPDRKPQGEVCLHFVRDEAVQARVGAMDALVHEPTECSANEVSGKMKAHLHMVGIGGTGMAQVAGLLQSAGYVITGSDNPIYPPMDKIIADLGIKPDIGFSAETFKKNVPDAVILANILSRGGSKKNEELEEIIANNVPVYSFPSALRHYFLRNATNIVISGTHGKTTTSSLVSHLLTELQFAPSFLIGGQPANFSAGFALRSRELFVLEGDEYDCAFFDKGPKFLHYEPKICLINNIEFDHADIYKDVEAIENEFLRLALLTKERGGIVIANMDDERVVKVTEKSKACVIGFSAHQKIKTQAPCWKLKSCVTLADGMNICCLKPDGKELNFKIGVFGEHNALNALGALAVLDAYQGGKINEKSVIKAMAGFRGVKRRFELLREKNGISVFDDFAHHPTAIVTTLAAFRSYMKSTGKTGRLIVCFDPKNATMRRNIFQEQLSRSFTHADVLFLGKVPGDLRVSKAEMLDGNFVAQTVKNARYFDDNEELFSVLKKEVATDDTVVFMSSGSFDGIPERFAKEL